MTQTGRPPGPADPLPGWWAARPVDGAPGSAQNGAEHLGHSPSEAWDAWDDSDYGAPSAGVGWTGGSEYGVGRSTNGATHPDHHERLWPNGQSQAELVAYPIDPEPPTVQPPWPNYRTGQPPGAGYPGHLQPYWTPDYPEPALTQAPHRDEQGVDPPTETIYRPVPAHELLDRESNASSALDRPEAKPAHPPRAVVRRRRARRRMLEWPFLIIFALLASVGIRAFAIQTFYIPSGSMHPTLLEGDRVLVNKLSYRLHEMHRGDVVVFRRPPNFPVRDDDLIKRVIGMPGDKVAAHDHQVFINGRKLNEPYVETNCGGTENFGPVTVPAGHLWMMGDNRCDSSDSRVFGPIDEKLVVGRAFVLIWPPGRVHWL